MKLTRRSMLVVCTGLVAAAAVTGGPAQDELGIHAVAGTVSYLEGEGGNVGLCVGEDGLFIVDSKVPRAGDEVERLVGEFTDLPVRFMLNTHWHGDHTGNNARLAKGAPILAHANVRRRLNGEDGVEGRKNEPGSAPEGSLPMLTYEDTITLHLNGEEIVILHFEKAHTDGDSVVLFTGSNVLHMGDLFFSGRFPFIDLDSGGSVQGYVDAVGGILESLDADVKIIPGHGPLSTIKELRAFHTMLVETSGRVREALKAGKTAADMKANGLLDDYAEGWDWDFIKSDTFIDALARDLAE